MVEGAALEMLYRGNSIVGSNPTLSAIFFAKKMAERSRKASLHCADRHNFTSSRGEAALH